MTPVGQYDRRIAEIYDLMYPDALGDIDDFCAFVRDRVKGDRVLEYAVGTGRLALPLSRAGLHVTGTDISDDMLAMLAAQNANGAVTAVNNDFIHDRLEGTFDAVLLMINTLFVARTLDEQIQVFQNAATNLTDDGFFLVETFNPSVYHAQVSSKLEMRNLDAGRVMFDQYSIEPISQLMFSQHTVLEGGTPFSFTHLLHYMFPLEIDAVARNAGLHLAERVSHWSGVPYTGASLRCLSVYRKLPRP